MNVNPSSLRKLWLEKIYWSFHKSDAAEPIQSCMMALHHYDAIYFHPFKDCNPLMWCCNRIISWYMYMLCISARIRKQYRLQNIHVTSLPFFVYNKKLIFVSDIYEIRIIVTKTVISNKNVHLRWIIWFMFN